MLYVAFIVPLFQLSVYEGLCQFAMFPFSGFDRAVFFVERTLPMKRAIIPKSYVVFLLIPIKGKESLWFSLVEMTDI